MRPKVTTSKKVAWSLQVKGQVLLQAEELKHYGILSTKYVK